MKTGFKILWLLALCAAFLSPAQAFAQAPERGAILKKFEADGNKIDYLGNAHGLDGWIVANPKGGVQFIYTTPDGAALAGMLFSPDGTSETGRQLEAFRKRGEGSQAAAPGADKSGSKSEKLYALLEAASWVSVGDKAAPYIYVFINVSCDHCQHFMKDIEGAVTSGKLQVRLLPYGKVDENRDGGAALLSVDQPMAAWNAFIAGDKTALGKDKVKEGAYQKVDANTALVQEWKLGGPPFTLYRRPSDGAVTAIVGRPENQMLLLAEFLK